jgi:putative GTP pyrophosphokinase
MSDDDASLDEIYRRMRPSMERAAARLRAVLLDVTARIDDRRLVRAEIDEVRIKELPSLKRKARNAGWSPDDALWECPDLIGGRVVCNNVEDVYRFEELLTETLPAESGGVSRQDYIKKPTAQGYRALHLNFRLNAADSFSVDLLACEIQIRSRLQDAWAELAHGDIYKQDPLPPDLRDRVNDLARLLATADATATDIRKRVARLTTPPEARPKLDRVSKDGLAFLFKEIFGRAPPDYVVTEAMNACHDLGVQSLAGLTELLKRQDLRAALAKAYRAFLPGAIPSETVFLAALYALSKGDRRAVSYVRKEARRELKEIDAIARREMLAALPSTAHELLADLEEPTEASNCALTYAEALGGAHDCARCGETIVDPYGFAENAREHYRLSPRSADKVSERIVQAVYSSGVDTGDLDNASYCSYCAHHMAKDD